MIKISLFTILLGTTLLIQGCGDKEKKTQEANAMIASNEYVLTSTENQQFVVKKELDGFVLENAKGKVVIFDIFATWCPPCQAAASHLSSLKKTFGDDLIVIGVSIEDGISNAELQAFKKEHGAEYPLVNSSDNRRLVSAIASALKLGERFPIPIMALYKDGKLINHYIGEVQEEFIASDINQALGK